MSIDRSTNLFVDILVTKQIIHPEILVTGVLSQIGRGGGH